jgi:hypothetical protein
MHIGFGRCTREGGDNVTKVVGDVTRISEVGGELTTLPSP